VDTGVVYCGDNRQRLALLPRASVDLIYLDPPFFSNRHYEVIWGDEAEVRSFEDRWEGGIYHYVEWMKERVIDMRRVLKPTGSLYLHCDWHASHYLKVMLDEVFGAANFLNNIVWCYGLGGSSSRYWPRKHDDILWYANSPGQQYFQADMVPATSARMAGQDKKAPDYWMIPTINNQAKERLGYPTQKPEELLERVVRSSCPEGGIVLDPFAGCGTTLVAAQRLRRKWIGIDISPTACNLMRRRLHKVGALDVRLVDMPATIDDLRKLKPFEFQNWIVDRINGVQAGRKSGDMGIDGWTFFLHDPVQIKQSEAIGRNVIDNFETAVTRDGKKRGFVIAFSFGHGAVEEAARVRRTGLDVQLVTVADLLDRLDSVMVQMGVASPTGALPGLEAVPMPTIDSSRHSADELIRSAKGDPEPN